MNLYNTIKIKQKYKDKNDLIKNLINSSLKRMPFHVLILFCCFLLTVSCTKHREQYGHSKEASTSTQLLPSDLEESFLNPTLSPQFTANNLNSEQNPQDIYRKNKSSQLTPY